MDDFFTVASFATLSGSVLIVIVVLNAIRHAFNWGPRWFGLALSIVVAFMALYTTSNLGPVSRTAGTGLIKYLLVFFNGCLIYTSAFGIQNTVISRPKVKVSGEPRIRGFTGDTAGLSEPGLSFRSPW